MEESGQMKNSVNSSGQDVSVELQTLVALFLGQGHMSALVIYDFDAESYYNLEQQILL
jgi:hypothetical protein